MICATCNDRGFVECDVGRSSRKVPCWCVIVKMNTEIRQLHEAVGIRPVEPARRTVSNMTFDEQATVTVAFLRMFGGKGRIPLALDVIEGIEKELT